MNEFWIAFGVSDVEVLYERVDDERAAGANELLGFDMRSILWDM